MTLVLLVLLLTMMTAVGSARAMAKSFASESRYIVFIRNIWRQKCLF
jgi:hypothetical protein